MQAESRKKPVDWRACLEDPAWVPYRFSAADAAFTLAYMPREAQRAVPFLDQRHMADAPQSAAAPLSDVQAAPIVRQPLHFICHTAFCCSTLLSRAFDLPGVSMGISEPVILLTMSKLMHTPGYEALSRQALGATLDLLSRPLAAGEINIVKPSNFSSLIAPQALEQRPDSKILIMYSTLDAFIAAIARRGMGGRIFAREMFQHFNATAPLNTGFSLPDLMMQADLQIAAQAWLMQTAFLQAVIDRYGPSRVRTLQDEALLADKPGMLARAAEFFGLKQDAQCWAEIANGPVFAHYGKDPSLPYTAATRDQILRNVRHVLAGEIDPALNWAKSNAPLWNAPLDLGNTLAN